MAKQSIGFVGIGKMGSRMVHRLIEVGYQLTIHDTNEAAVAPFVEKGAVFADSPAAVASVSEIVLASLPAPSVVQAVALGPRGLAEGSKIKIFIDLSTTGSIVAKSVADGLAAKGILSVDSPVSGGIAGAEKGTLAVMVSCPDDVFMRVKPILNVLGRLFLIGSQPGQAQTMKLLNNLLSATAMAITSEALVMGVKAGLDPRQMVEILNAGTGRNSATLDKIAQQVIPRTFNVGFTIGLLDKDVRLCLEEAGTMGIPMIVGAAVRQLVAITAGDEGGNADMTTVVKVVEKWAGVHVG
jgi:3-hydroxyisobutyrate dehydrogenase-like beta-hydroxyacid dehydrogenase